MLRLQPIHVIVGVLAGGCRASPPPLESATMYRRTDAGAQLLADGAWVAAGDQLRPCARGAGWVSLLGQDGTERTVVYGSWLLSQEEERCAPFALEVDGAPGPELFWLTVSWEPSAQAEPHAPEAAGWRFSKR